MTAGMQLETQVQNYCTLTQIPCAHGSEHEDRYKAIDLWISGLPIQVTLGRWSDKLSLARIKQKWEWTQFQSSNTAILCVFDMECANRVAMFRNMAKGLIVMKKAGLKTGILLIDATEAKVLRGGE